MTTDKWMDAGGFSEGMQDALFPIHDRIGGIQSSVLTMLMNPTKLRRIYDNEFLVPRDQDALTLPEMLRTLTSAVWTELEKGPSGNTSERNPYISSLRRNLQAEHAERLIDLSMPQAGGTEAMKAISNQAMMQLRQISAKIGTIIGEKGENANLDAYSLAHLKQTRMRIEKALDARLRASRRGSAATVHRPDLAGGGGGNPWHGDDDAERQGGGGNPDGCADGGNPVAGVAAVLRPE